MKKTVLLSLLLLSACSSSNDPSNIPASGSSGSGNNGGQTTTSESGGNQNSSTTPPATSENTPTSPAPASTSEQTGQKQGQFAISTYQDIARRKVLTKTSLEGTWAAVWETTKQRSNIVGEPVVEGTPTLLSETVEFVVIKAGASADEYQVASCHGDGFETVTRTGNTLNTRYRDLTVVDDQNMTARFTRMDSWDLKPRPGTPSGFEITRTYDETTTATGRFIKLSDATTRLSELSQEWVDDRQTINKNVYCASIEEFDSDKLNRVRLGSDDALEFVITQSDLDPAVPLARVLETTFTETDGRKGLLDTGETQCKAFFNFNEVLPNKKNIEFDFRYTIIEQLPAPDNPGATRGERRLTGTAFIDLSAI